MFTKHNPSLALMCSPQLELLLVKKMDSAWRLTMHFRVNANLALLVMVGLLDQAVLKVHVHCNINGLAAVADPGGGWVQNPPPYQTCGDFCFHRYP